MSDALGQAMGNEVMPSLPVVPWTTAGPPVELPAVHDPDADVLLGQMVGLIQLGAATSPRSVQSSIGSSEAGYACDRRIAYKLAGARRANLDDPVRTLVGLGLHLALAELFGRLADGSQRFWTGVKVLYRDIPGELDVYDRFTGTVIDFKSSTKAKIARLRRDGPPKHGPVQVQLYGAGLSCLGEQPRAVALLYLPIDGTLADAWLWRAPFNQRIADEAVDRIERLRGKDPSAVDAHPDRLCPWCAHFRPGSTDLALGCPGNS
jgi:hypothetical protein